MDVFDWTFRLIFRVLTLMFSPRPVVEKRGGLVLIRSSWRTTLLTLGAVGRRAVIDPKVRVIRFDARIFWFFHRRRRIEFDWIASVFSTYADLGGGYGSHVEQDLFCVGLLLKDNSHVTLFRFFGQGEFVNYSWMPDWWFVGENAASAVLPHDMENRSVTLTDLLEAYLKVPITNEL